MSERMTQASCPSLPSNPGIMDYGRQSRAEMIKRYRAYYQHQLDEAAKALAVPDDAIVVETFVGVYVRHNKQLVTE